tara:strand:+ start:2430 stop:4076 length:1647 start_codon:yes stop_codon:yes gene_type:complete
VEPSLRVIPLGGLGEIGKNMMALEYADDIVVIDCGVQFASDDLPGIDLIIPDISYLIERSHKVKGILITHGHEDHIGALPFVLPSLNVPVYAPKLAHGLISVKVKERSNCKNAVLHSVDPGSVYEFGDNFSASWFRVCHSIPDAMGIVIDTPMGSVVHTGDFKIDHTPLDGFPIDIAALAKKGSEGILLLCSDSTYAEVPGFTPSESILLDELDKAVRESEGRVMIATFASLITRIQLVIDIAVKYGRKVSIVGRSMVDNVKMAQEMGYLNIPDNTLIPIGQTNNLPPNEIVLLTTGSQGEPTSALSRIAKNDHREVQVMPGDTVVISATPIPGNELLVSRTIDQLLRQEAIVLYDKLSTVHVHGHASREELKIMLGLTRPKYFVPVHGEYRHLIAHAKLAWDMGLAESGIFVLEDGDVLEISSQNAVVTDHVAAGPVYLDGSTTHSTESQVLKDRRYLSRDGIVVIACKWGVDGLEESPKIMSSGFIEIEDTNDLFESLGFELERVSAENYGGWDNEDSIKTKIRQVARKFIQEQVRKRPMIVPIVL